MLVWATGGFSTRVTGLRLTARDPVRPLAAGLALLALYSLWSRRRIRADLDWLEDRSERFAPALVVLCGAAAAAIGVWWGTYAASGADSYGYLSQADLWLRGAIVQEEPLARRFSWPNVDGIFSPLGYRPGVVPHTIVPIYSPGLPLLMAGAKVLVGACGQYLIVPASAIVLVWSTFVLGRTVMSARASAAAAMLVATSPATIYQTVLPMSDIPVAAAWTLALALLVRGGIACLIASGVAAGVAILIRPNLAPLVAVPVAALLLERGEPIGARVRRAAMFAPGMFLAAAFVATLNQYLYGSPLRSGYDALPQLFSWSNVQYNAIRYTERFMLTASPALILAAIPLVVRAFRQAGRGPSARLLLYGTIAVMLALYLPYARFGEWWYLRFLLPAYPALYITFCGGAAWILARLSRQATFAAGSLGLLRLVLFGLERSVTLGAFGMQRFEGRYVAVGRWVGEHLPENAVILSKQHSGSVRYYGGRPTLRYDRIELLRAVIDDLVKAGHHPYLLLEDWERPEFTNRFLGVGFERLSWQPLARMRQPEPLALYDLLNRASEDPPVDIPSAAPTCGGAR